MDDSNLTREIEQKIFRFDLFKPEHHDKFRDKQNYKHNIVILKPIAEKIGVMSAAKMYKTVMLYSSSNYGRMNNSLRAGKIPTGTNEIDKYISMAKPSGLRTLYRGVDGSFFKTLQVGSVLIDHAFVSTTSDSETARYFASRKTIGGVITLSGVDQISVPMFDREQGESEYLLPRGCKFTVTEINGKTAKMSVKKA